MTGTRFTSLFAAVAALLALPLQLPATSIATTALTAATLGAFAWWAIPTAALIPGPPGGGCLGAALAAVPGQHDAVTPPLSTSPPPAGAAPPHEHALRGPTSGSASGHAGTASGGGRDSSGDPPTPPQPRNSGAARSPCDDVAGSRQVLRPGRRNVRHAPGPPLGRPCTWPPLRGVAP